MAMTVRAPRKSVLIEPHCGEWRPGANWRLCPKSCRLCRSSLVGKPLSVSLPEKGRDCRSEFSS